MRCSALLFAAALVAVSVHAQESSHGAAKPNSRAEATAIIANARKILTPNGIERLEKIRIGGIPQWILIRGVDRRNPVLVVFHGGPGYVDMPTTGGSGAAGRSISQSSIGTSAPPERLTCLPIPRRSGQLSPWTGWSPTPKN